MKRVNATSSPCCSQKVVRQFNRSSRVTRIGLFFLFCGLFVMDPVWSATNRTEKASDARTERKVVATRTSETKKAEEKRVEKQREATAKQRDATEKQRDAVEKQRDAVEKQRETVEGQRETVERQRDEVEKQRETVERQRDAVSRQRDVSVERQSESIERQRETIRSDRSGEGSRRSEWAQPRNERSSSNSYWLGLGNRLPERNTLRVPNLRYKNERERCAFCLGIGFSMTHDRMHRIRCTHCYGRGFDISYHRHLIDICPICYGTVDLYQGSHSRTLRYVADKMTEKLNFLLDLSSGQERRVNRIILDYLLANRRDDWENWIEIRDSKLMQELNSQQRRDFIDYRQSLDYRDVCDRCFDWF